MVTFICAVSLAEPEQAEFLNKSVCTKANGCAERSTVKILVSITQLFAVPSLTTKIYVLFSVRPGTVCWISLLPPAGTVAVPEAIGVWLNGIRVSNG